MKIQSYLPGFLTALLIAVIATYIESLLPVPLIGASVIALFIGIVMNQFLKPRKILDAGLRFTSKKVLKFSIILLGASFPNGFLITWFFLPGIMD